VGTAGIGTDTLIKVLPAYAENIKICQQDINCIGVVYMKNNRLFVLEMLAVLLTLGFVLVGCDNGTNGDTFVAVTDITGVPTVAIMSTPLSLSGIVVPSNATNRTIVWNGNGVSNGQLTATSATNYTVTATITNGASESTPYTRNFTITAYDTSGGGSGNPFNGKTLSASTGDGYTVVVTITDATWAANIYSGSYHAGLYNSGTYTYSGKGAQWTVTTVGTLGTDFTNVGDTGLAILLDNGSIVVANFYDSNMNGTYSPAP
jgi:hypothetical protein